MNISHSTERSCFKVARQLVDAQVRCESPSWIEDSYRRRTQEAKATALEQWAKDFNDFIRDHRSQDPVRIYIEREYKDLCSHCHAEWEPFNDEGVERCANCGAQVVNQPEQP